MFRTGADTREVAAAVLSVIPTWDKLRARAHTHTHTPLYLALYPSQRPWPSQIAALTFNVHFKPMYSGELWDCGSAQ
jgi:hypothetical protein